MSDKFTVEIITPNETILKTETNEVNIPSFEGQMGILKDHIPLITFLRPGIISLQDQEKKYYVEEGTVEFSNNNLLILTSTARDLTKLNQDSIEELLKSAENKFSDNYSSDKEKYISSYKISTLKEINQ
ncbi:ATP synthase F1 subunit epsilon [Pelagibacteraceae bacterium]|nr:ATP synthase F1 subunit epsilon [Pelagibacteraceae bacterium]